MPEEYGSDPIGNGEPWKAWEQRRGRMKQNAGADQTRDMEAGKPISQTYATISSAVDFPGSHRREPAC